MPGAGAVTDETSKGELTDRGRGHHPTCPQSRDDWDHNTACRCPTRTVPWPDEVNEGPADEELTDLFDEVWSATEGTGGAAGRAAARAVFNAGRAFERAPRRVTKEQVEAAAAAICGESLATPWLDVSPAVKGNYRIKARAAVKALGLELPEGT